jgi:hypothetical protein
MQYRHGHWNALAAAKADVLLPTQATVKPLAASGGSWLSSERSRPMKMQKSRMRIADTSIARVPPKQADPHYLTRDWTQLRQRIFARDRFRCVIPGCGRPAKVCEHVRSRRKGGTDDDSNLCSLCREHDNHFKEDTSGERRNPEEWARIFSGG